MSEHQSRFIDTGAILKFWPMLASVVVIAVSWGVAAARFEALKESTTSQIIEIQKEVASLQAKYESTDRTLVTLQVGIQRIETTLEFIKEKVQ